MTVTAGERDTYKKKRGKPAKKGKSQHNYTAFQRCFKKAAASRVNCADICVKRAEKPSISHNYTFNEIGNARILQP